MTVCASCAEPLLEAELEIGYHDVCQPEPRLTWPDGSPVAIGQPVRIVIGPPRYAGSVGTVASLHRCRPSPTLRECSNPLLHDEIGVEGVGPGLAWFRVSELQRSEAQEGRPDRRGSPRSPANCQPVAKAAAS